MFYQRLWWFFGAGFCAHAVCMPALPVWTRALLLAGTLLQLMLGLEGVQTEKKVAGKLAIALMLTRPPDAKLTKRQEQMVCDLLRDAFLYTDSSPDDPRN